MKTEIFIYLFFGLIVLLWLLLFNLLGILAKRDVCMFYIKFEVSVIVSQIITKFTECVG